MLGISNISFGLPAAAREVVNSVFLYYCTKAGLGSGHRQRREAGALRLHSGAGAAPGRESALQHAPAGCRRRSAAHAPEDWREQIARTEGRHQPVPHRRHHRPFPPGHQARKAARRGPAARSAPGQLHHRRHQGRPDRRPRPQAGRRRRAARHHQRPADGRAWPRWAGCSTTTS